MICRECGAYNPDHASYCKVCAASLKNDTEQQEQSLGATRTFVRPSWTVPTYAKKAEAPEEPEADEAVESEEEEPIAVKPVMKASAKKTPVVEEEPEEEEEPFHDDPIEKPAARKTPVFARKVEEDFDEPDELDSFDDFDEDEEELPPRPVKKAPQKRAPIRIREEEDDEDDEDEDDEEELPLRPVRKAPVKKAPVRIREEEEEEDEEDDSYEYEPTPPKRDRKGKSNGPLFWILLASIIVVIICIVVAGVLMLSSSNALSCTGIGQGTQQTSAQTSTQQPSQQTSQQQPSQQQTKQTENDPNVVKLEESINDNGQPCVIMNITATPHSVVTLQLPNQSDSVTPNDSDNTVIYRLTVTKDTFNPNVPMTESTYEVNPVIYRTESDGTTHQLTVPSFVLTFPTLTIDLEKPVENDDGIIMADKQDNVAISGHVDDFDVSVTVDGQPVIVYEGGLFMADYKMTATEPVTVVITAEKPNYVSTSKEIVVNPYVFTPEKMILTVENDPIKELRVEKSTTISVRGKTLVGATLKATTDQPSKVVCGSVTVDSEGSYTFMVTMDPTFYGVSKITLTAEKEDAESGEIAFYVARAYESKDAFNSGYNKTKTYKEIGSKNPLDTIVAQKDTYASPSYGFRITAKVESVETRADGLSYVKLTLTSGESVIAINFGSKWDPASNIGKKYNLYGNFLGLSESDDSTPLFAIFYAVAK